MVVARPLARARSVRETIRRSDDGFRGAQNQVGLLLANHVVSAVDALISSRLAAAAGRAAALHTTVGSARRPSPGQQSPSDWTSHDLAREPRDLDRPADVDGARDRPRIDNFVFLSIITGKLPPSQQPAPGASAWPSPCCSVSRCWPRFAVIIRLTAPLFTVLGRASRAAT